MGNNQKGNVLRHGVDNYDLSILSVLSENADLTASELSGKVHLSRTAVVRRVNNMRERGLISVPREEIDFEQLGFSVHAYVHVVSPSKSSYDLLDRLLERPEVLSASVIIGHGLMMIEIIAKNKSHLHCFLNWLKAFGDSSTHYVLRQHRSPLNLHDRLRQTDEILATQDDVDG